MSNEKRKLSNQVIVDCIVYVSCIQVFGILTLFVNHTIPTIFGQEYPKQRWQRYEEEFCSYIRMGVLTIMAGSLGFLGLKVIDHAMIGKC